MAGPNYRFFKVEGTLVRLVGEGRTILPSMNMERWSGEAWVEEPDWDDVICEGYEITDQPERVDTMKAQITKFAREHRARTEQARRSA